MNYRVIYTNELQHHGILGQKWGVRRFQDYDGTLTDKGRKRYNAARKSIIESYSTRNVGNYDDREGIVATVNSTRESLKSMSNKARKLEEKYGPDSDKVAEARRNIVKLNAMLKATDAARKKMRELELKNLDERTFRTGQAEDVGKAEWYGLIKSSWGVGGTSLTKEQFDVVSKFAEETFWNSMPLADRGSEKFKLTTG